MDEEVIVPEKDLVGDEDTVEAVVAAEEAEDVTAVEGLIVVDAVSLKNNHHKISKSQKKHPRLRKNLLFPFKLVFLLQLQVLQL